MFFPNTHCEKLMSCFSNHLRMFSLRKTALDVLHLNTKLAVGSLNVTTYSECFVSFKIINCNSSDYGADLVSPGL